MKYYILLVVFALLIMPISMAMDWDNIKEVSPDGKISIYNSFIIPGVIKGDKLAEYTLLENGNSIINAWAKGTLELYARNKLFANLEFNDRLKRLVNVKYKLYYNASEEYTTETPIYETICSKIDNQTDILGYTDVCDNVLKEVKKETKTREVMKEYKDEELNPGVYKWEIIAEKPKNYIVDWVAESQGIKLDNWAWWNTTFNYARTINLTGGSTVLTDFTVLINLTYSATSNFNQDFSDIRFTNGSCADTQSAELVYEKIYNGTAAMFWVKVPSLAIGLNQLCMYYGNSTFVTTTSDPVNAWDGYYLSVYHLEGDYKDSKGHKNGGVEGAPTLNLTNCAIGNCYTFDGNDAIVLDNTYDDMAEMTIEGFGLLRSTADYRNLMAQTGSANDRAFQLRVDTGVTDAGLYAYKSDGGAVSATATGSFGLNKWNYIAGTSDGTVNVIINSTTTTGGAFNSNTDVSTNTAVIGGAFAGSYIQFWLGEIDEVRFSTTNRTAAWLNRSYSNSMQGFFKLGAEQTQFNEIIITLNNPNIDYNSSNKDVLFNCSAKSPLGVDNLTLIIDNKFNLTLTNGVTYNNLSLQVTRTLGEGVHNWTCSAAESTSATKTAVTRLIFIDSVAPKINILAPLKNTEIQTFISPTNVSFNVSIFETGYLSACYYYNNSQNTTVTCGNNASISTIPGYNTFIFYANDSVNNFAENKTSFLLNYLKTIVNFSGTAITEENTTIFFNMTATNITAIAANLTYNNIVYVMNLDFVNDTNANFHKIITVPTISPDPIIK